MEARITVRKPGDTAALALASWWCPACARPHEVPLHPTEGWILEGQLEAPTLRPTVIVKRVRGARELSTCHSRIRAGSIEYLTTSTHALAGQVVAMEPA